MVERELNKRGEVDGKTQITPGLSCATNELPSRTLKSGCRSASESEHERVNSARAHARYSCRANWPLGRREGVMMTTESETCERCTNALCIDKIGEAKRASVSRDVLECFSCCSDPHKNAQRERDFQIALCVLCKSKA
eukprot:IDg12522t1